LEIDLAILVQIQLADRLAYSPHTSGSLVTKENSIDGCIAPYESSGIGATNFTVKLYSLLGK